MKIRMDFVTNSSSSSFIIAKKEGFSEKQKEVILEYVANRMFGKKVLNADSSEEEIKKFLEDNYLPERYLNEIKENLKDGKGIYQGYIDFECCEESYGAMFEDLWNKLERTSEKDEFSIIDGDLSY